MTPVSRQADEHFALPLRIEFSADVFDIAFAIDQFIFDRELCADESRRDQLSRFFRREFASRRDRFDQNFLPVRDDRLHALAHRRRHRIAVECLGRALVFLPLQGLRLDLQLVERVLQKNAAGRHAKHREHRVRIGDNLARSCRDQVFAQSGVIASQQRDHPLTARLRSAHQAMDFMRGGEPGAEARDLDDDRANLVVDSRRLERIAQMVEALCAASHDLIERRARHILFDRPRQPNHQHSVMRDLRRPDDREIEGRH